MAKKNSNVNKSDMCKNKKSVGAISCLLYLLQIGEQPREYQTVIKQVKQSRIETLDVAGFTIVKPKSRL